IIEQVCLGYTPLRHHLSDRTLQFGRVESRRDFAPHVEWNRAQFLSEDCCCEIAVCGNAFIDIHFEPTKHDRNEPGVKAASVTPTEEQPYLPAGTCAPDEVKHFAWLR